MIKTILIFFPIILSFSLTSCALTKFAGHYKSVDKKGGRLNGEVYTTDFNSYRIGTLSNDWKRINIKGGDLAFYNSLYDSTITINSTCRIEKRRYSLKALSNSLVTGIKNKEIKTRENINIDLSEGLYTEYSAELNNENFGLATLVYKSEKCNYDFSLSSAENKFDKNIITFKNFISSFNEISAK